MANDKDKSTSTSTPTTSSPEKPQTLTSKCSVCAKGFPNVHACLKHELLDHSMPKKKQPKSSLQNILIVGAKFLNTPEKLEERAQLQTNLKKCEAGQELRTIFELLCMKTDCLNLIFTRIQTCLEKELRSSGNLKIYAFGSIASGLALRDCDIDIYVDVSKFKYSPRHQSSPNTEGRQFQYRNAFNRINQILHRSPHFTDVFSIRGARVPIIKCKHQDTGFSIDINVSCPSSKENTQFIYELVRSDDRIHELLLFLKLWAKHTQIIGKANMTSYCLITMVIFFLQQPLKHSDEEDGGGGGDVIDYILQPIINLQDNCVPHMVQGINYAFNLRDIENQPRIPPSVQTWILIKEFFKFYQNFNFEDNIISPFYGKTVRKTDLTSDLCQEYSKQLNTITQFLEGEPAEELQINRCMCVQDSFCLNHNVAKAMLPPHKQYFILCLQNANKICENSQNLNQWELYDQLLYATINVPETPNVVSATIQNTIMLNVNNMVLPKPDVNVNDADNHKNLLYTVTATKADLRTLAAYNLSLTGFEALLRIWCKHYVAAIKTFITDIYRMDIQIQSPAQQKQQKLDDDSKNVLGNQSFNISTSVDLWSNRCFQKSSSSFMEYQLEQTERLHKLRRQDPKFSVPFNAILTLDILPKFMGINIKFESADGTSIADLNKKSPLRKFFNVFKNTLQNYNLKDALKSSGGGDQISPINGNKEPIVLDSNSDNDSVDSDKSTSVDSETTTTPSKDSCTPTLKKFKRTT